MRGHFTRPCKTKYYFLDFFEIRKLCLFELYSSLRRLTHLRLVHSHGGVGDAPDLAPGVACHQHQVEEPRDSAATSRIEEELKN